MQLQSITSALLSQVRPVLGFPGYRVWTFGRVESCWTKGRNSRTTDEWHQVRPTPYDRGHLRVHLSRDGKSHRRFVHRLVLEAFVGPCPAGHEACHDPDRDPVNNNLSNLRWDTKKANSLDAVRHGTHGGFKNRGEASSTAKLTRDIVEQIMDLRRTEGLGGKKICLRLGLPESVKHMVDHIVTGWTWNSVTGLPSRRPREQKGAANVGPFVAELRRFIERLKLMEADSRVTKRDLAVLHQGMRDAWTETGRVGVNSTCITTVKGTILGCTQPAVALPGSTVRFVGNVSGHDYGTWTATDGTYNFGLYLVASEALTMYLKGPGPRFLEVAAFGNPQTASPCNVNTLFDQNVQGPGYPSVTTGLASGFRAYDHCGVPIAENLTLVDSRMGVTTTVVYGFGTFGRDWQVILSPTERYLFRNQVGGVQIDAQVAGVNYQWVGGVWVTSNTCPDGGSVKFDKTWTWTGPGAGPYVAGDTIRIYEP